MSTSAQVAHGRPPAGPECLPLRGERIRWFTGRFMTARDLTDEQRYHVEKRWLHNRLMHGTGVVCGLTVAEHPRPDCRDEWVAVRPGIAIDCCGREITLRRGTAVRWTRRSESAQEGVAERAEEALLAVRYTEVELEPLPALLGDDGCAVPSRRRLEASRIREDAELVVVNRLDVPDGCWPPTGETSCRDDCNDDCFESDDAGCLEPNCTCGCLVPLATLRRSDGPIALSWHALPFVYPPGYLTRIVGTNWPHGGELTLSELDAMDGRLEVTFDRPLRWARRSAADDERGQENGTPAYEEMDEDRPPGVGISEFSFRVERGDLDADLNFVDHEEAPYAEGCTAVFPISRRLLQPSGPRVQNIAGEQLHIALFGDFILDCRGNPIVADNLRGEGRSSGQLPGGVFRSWFFVREG